MITIDGSGWACTDCIQLIANGEAPADMSPEEVTAWQARIDQHTVGVDVVPGGPHRDGCKRDDRYCDCEYDAFSMAPCDVCGGNLGGARHAVTFFAAS